MSAFSQLMTVITLFVGSGHDRITSLTKSHFLQLLPPFHVFQLKIETRVFVTSYQLYHIILNHSIQCIVAYCCCDMNTSAYL